MDRQYIEKKSRKNKKSKSLVVHGKQRGTRIRDRSGTWTFFQWRNRRGECASPSTAEGPGSRLDAMLMSSFSAAESFRRLLLLGESLDRFLVQSHIH